MKPYPLSLDQKVKQEPKQTQRLMMTPQMQQAIYFLQLPQMELSGAINQEMEQNPVLEYLQEEEDTEPQELDQEEEEVSTEKEIEFDESKFELLRQLDDEFRDYMNESGPFVPRRSSEEEKYKSYLESSISDRPSLFEHLMFQAHEAFSSKEDVHIAEVLIGHLDQQGFLKTPLEEIATCFSLPIKSIRRVLEKIQTFDPIGIGSKNVKEVLLAQLRLKGQANTVAYRIIDKCFDDLIHNRLPQIQKLLKIPAQEIHEVIRNEIACLELHPATSFIHVDAPTLVPDVRLRQEGEGFVTEVDEEFVQPLCINRKYLHMLEDTTLTVEVKDFIKSKILSAKWLMRNLHSRNETLIKISNFIAEYQKTFFSSPQGTLLPLTMREVAQELNLHESTVARAVSNKYIDTPRGILPLRYFFSNAYAGKEGEDVSSKTVRNFIKEIIEKEDKTQPLSDEAISQMMRKEGISCARRTVAKYRSELKLGTAQQRRRY